MERSNEREGRWMHRVEGGIAARPRDRERRERRGVRSAEPASAMGMPAHLPVAGRDGTDCRALARDAVHRAAEVVRQLEADQCEIDRLRRDTRLLLEQRAA